MIAYFDASALVKRHADERGSRETLEFAARAEVVATSLVSRAEVAAALAKALEFVVRAGLRRRQVLVCRILTDCGEVAERLKAAVC